MAFAAGDRIGPYEILAPLGKGGMGEVCRAYDSRLKREVAIKTSIEKFNERFEREARAIAALNHPNICTLYDIGPDYLVMELVEGSSPKGPMPLEEAFNVAAQIAAALEAAHDKGIVHRDLKPDNVKITQNGGNSAGNLAEAGALGDGFRISPDGQRVALEIVENDNSDIWVFGINDHSTTRLTFDAKIEAWPIWSVDGKAWFIVPGTISIEKPRTEAAQKSFSSIRTRSNSRKTGVLMVRI
jgi:serine/threonine protein kinase